MKLLIYKIFIISLIGIFGFSESAGQSAHSLRRSGDAAYKKQDYIGSLYFYEEANKKDPAFKSAYNAGNALFSQQKYDEAINKYASALSLPATTTEKSIAQYNLGNSYYKSDKNEEAIEAYKQSLRLNPTDIDAKKNLTRALEKKKQQDRKDKEDQQKKDDPEKEDPNQQQKPQSGEGNQDPTQAGQDQQNPAKQDPGKQQPKNPGQPRHLNKKEAEDLLRIINDEEQKTRGKVMRGQPQEGTGNGKDW